MHFVVCAKQILDPDTPPSAFKIDEAKNEVIPAPGIAPVLSQFDGIAAEAALRIKEKIGDVKITVISLGKGSAQAAIKQVLAMGADEGLLLEDDAFENGDHYTTAVVLSEAIKKLGDVDAVFCGRQAADWDMGQVGLGISQLLDIPCAIIGKNVDVSDNKMTVERVLLDGVETVEMPLPAVVTVSNELGEPRYPKLQQIMQAAKKTVTKWNLDDLENLNKADVGEAGRKLKLEKLFIPDNDSDVEFIEGENAQEKANNLVAKLREAKIL